MSEHEAAPKPHYRQIAGIAESLEAIDEVIGAAQRSIKIFDISLSNRGFNSPARAATFRSLDGGEQFVGVRTAVNRHGRYSVRGQNVSPANCSANWPAWVISVRAVSLSA